MNFRLKATIILILAILLLALAQIFAWKLNPIKLRMDIDRLERRIDGKQ